MSTYQDQRVAIERLTEDAEKMLRSSSDEYASALLSKYEDFSQRVQQEISFILQQISEDGYASYSDFQRFQCDTRVMQSLSQQIAALNNSVIPDLENGLVQQYRDAYNTSAWALDETTPPNIDVNYQMPPEDAVRQLVSSDWEGAMFSQRLGAINDAMARDIQSEVTQGLLSGDSNQDIANRISDVIGDENSDYMYRAKMIATSETHRASNLGRNSFFDQNEEYIEDWFWVSRAITSPRICDDCAECSGHTWDEVINEISQDQDHDEYEYEIAHLHPRCACSWMSRPKPWKDLLGKDLSDGLDERPWYQMAYSQGGSTVAHDPMEYSDWASEYLNEGEM